MTDDSEAVIKATERPRARIDQVDDVVEIIRDVTKQTNLLALNVSTEASHAGEAFAAVAEEMNGLHEEVRHPAGDIVTPVQERGMPTTSRFRSTR